MGALKLKFVWQMHARMTLLTCIDSREASGVPGGHGNCLAICHVGPARFAACVNSGFRGILRSMY